MTAFQQLLLLSINTPQPTEGHDPINDLATTVGIDTGDIPHPPVSHSVPISPRQYTAMVVMRCHNLSHGLPLSKLVYLVYPFYLCLVRSLTTQHSSIYLSIYLFIYILGLICRERKREKHRSENSSSIGCLLHTTYQG